MELCTRPIEELWVELRSLEARRSDLVEEISESQPSIPEPAELAEFVGDIQRALREQGAETSPRFLPVPPVSSRGRAA